MTTSSTHVLHIASGDLWAGAEVQLYTLARALQKRGDTRVSVLLMNEGELAERLRKASIEVFVLPENTLNFLQLLIKTIALISRLRPDVIHTHRIKENLLGGIAGLLLRIPSLRTQHGAEEHPASWWAPHKAMLQKVDYWLALFAQKQVIAVTPELAGKLRQRLPPKRVCVIENGIDPENFQISDLGKLDLRFQNATRRVGIVGRLAPVKRVDLFIDMAALVNELKFYNVEFFVIGDGPLRDALQEKAISFGLDHKLHFLGHQNSVHSYLKNLDALVMCSDHEGMPMTLLEAMSLGVTVIGHNVGGIAILLNNGNSGWIVNDHTAQGYAEALIKCLSDELSSKNCRRMAQALISENYSAAKNAKLTAELYQEILR